LILLGEILNHRVARAELAQGIPNLRDRHRLGKLQLRHGAAREIDAEQRPFGKKQNEDH
jgi:hypothetical protein